jgi:hypothetical protein
MFKRSLLLISLSFTLLSINALGQGHGNILPPNHINPRFISQGAQAWWFGPQSSGNAAKASTTSLTFGSNVDAANPNEDVTTGQSETAIAAAGSLVTAAWNDGTGFFVSPSTNRKASLTGVGFSRNGGQSFTDLGGLPNNNPTQTWFGDASVVAVDGGAYFIVSSLYLPIGCITGTPTTYAIAISVGHVTATGVNFTNPIIAANGGNACSSSGGTAFLDKDFMRYEPITRTLAISYTRFSFTGFGTGQIEVVKAHVPTIASALTSASFSAPIVVWPEESNVENEGAYPVVVYNSATRAADVYVAWERNWGSNSFNGDPYIYIHAAEIHSGTASPRITGGPSNPVVVTAGQLNSNGHGGVKSLDLVPIPGYSRGTSNDFPRIAWGQIAQRIVVVWNDASHHPLGDIFLRAFATGLTSPGAIEKLNADNTGAVHMFPAVCFESNGSMVTSWYDRRNFVPDSAWTDLFADIRPSPYATSHNFKVTTTPTNWNATSSIIIPNFGDYTDNACTANSAFFTWSDGRLGCSQPFVAP